MDGTQAVSGTPNPRTAMIQSPSELLAENMRKAGLGPLPDGHAAHHMVAWDDSRAEIARDILADANIPINDARNGIYLPQTPENTVAEALERHQTIHTDEYYQAIEDRLLKAAEADSVEGELARIRNLIMRGEFPH